MGIAGIGVTGRCALKILGLFGVSYIPRRHAARIDADAYPGSTGTTRVVGGGDYARDVLWLRFPSDLRMPIVPLARVETVLVLLKALGS